MYFQVKLVYFNPPTCKLEQFRSCWLLCSHSPPIRKPSFQGWRGVGCTVCGRHRWKERKPCLETKTVTHITQSMVRCREGVLCFPAPKALTLAWSLLNGMGWCVLEASCISCLPGRVSASWVTLARQEEENKANNFLFRIVTCFLKPRLLLMLSSLLSMISMYTVPLISLGHFIWFIFKWEENGICSQTLVYVSNTV